MAKTTKKKIGKAKFTQYYSSSLFLDIDEHGNVTEGRIDMDGVVDPCGIYGEVAGQFSTKRNLLWNEVKSRGARWHIVEQIVEFLKKKEKNKKGAARKKKHDAKKREEKKAVDKGALSTPTPPPRSPLSQVVLNIALGLNNLMEATSKQREDITTLVEATSMQREDITKQREDITTLANVTFKQGEDITAAKNNAILAIETAGKAQDTADGAVETAGRADKKADEACSTIKKLEKKLSHLMQSTKMNFSPKNRTGYASAAVVSGCKPGTPASLSGVHRSPVAMTPSINIVSTLFPSPPESSKKNPGSYLSGGNCEAASLMYSHQASPGIPFSSGKNEVASYVKKMGSDDQDMDSSVDSEEDAETNNKLGYVTNMKQDIAGYFSPNQAPKNFFDSGSKGSDNLDSAVPVPTTPSNATSHGATSSQKTAFKCVTTVLFGSPIPKFSPMSQKKYDKEYNQCSGSANCGHCDKLKHTKTPSSGFSRFGFGW